jgi:hypothetical protein
MPAKLLLTGIARPVWSCIHTTSVPGWSAIQMRGQGGRSRCAPRAVAHLEALWRLHLHAAAGQVQADGGNYLALMQQADLGVDAHADEIALWLSGVRCMLGPFHRAPLCRL